MWTYFLGPFLSVFPRRWREALPFARCVNWARATAISGVAESTAALIVLAYWYSYAMNTWVGHGVEAALNGNSGPELRPQDIGGVALIVWASHPLTWLIGYFGLEGALRVGVALTGSGLGTLPFFLIDKTLSLLFGARAPKPLSEAGLANPLSSAAAGVRAEIAAAGLRSVSDELSLKRDGPDEILEICACRKKEGWDPPRTVRYQDAYYRLEAASLGKRPRPFRYILRRLPVGVPGRTVLLYDPTDAVILQER